MDLSLITFQLDLLFYATLLSLSTSRIQKCLYKELLVHLVVVVVSPSVLLLLMLLLLLLMLLLSLLLLLLLVLVVGNG